jgi:hypothetical protein
VLWWQYTLGIALGGFIALASSVLVTLWLEKLKQNAERKRLAAIIADELQAIVDYITENDFDSKLTAAAEAVRKGSTPNVAQFSVLRGSFIIASAKIDSPIGIFPERLALQTASLSTLLRGIIEDFTILREAWGVKVPTNSVARQRLCRFLHRVRWTYSRERFESSLPDPGASRGIEIESEPAFLKSQHCPKILAPTGLSPTPAFLRLLDLPRRNMVWRCHRQFQFWEGDRYRDCSLPLGSRVRRAHAR